jgi:hypothetical protein
MNRRQISASISVGFMLAVFLVVVGAVLWIERPFADRFLDACESVVRDRLSATLTYKRASMARLPDRFLDAAEYALLSSETSPNVRLFERQQIEAGSQTPAVHILGIEFEISDYLGETAKKRSICEYISYDGDASKATDFSVIVDGKSQAVWLAERIRNAR